MFGQRPEIITPTKPANKEARTRYITENKADVANMQTFFTSAGLSMEKSLSCAEKSVLLDIHTPRRLFYYIQSVPAFTLLSLGMDRFDADMVLEDLNKEFGAVAMKLTPEKEKVKEVEVPVPSPVPSPVADPDPNGVQFVPRKVTGRISRSSDGTPVRGMNSIIEISESDDEGGEGKDKFNHNSMRRSRKGKGVSNNSSSKSNRNSSRIRNDDEDDIGEMQEFFRFAGLSCKMSRSCAEESIAKHASSPKKLYKYLELKILKLPDLGMDTVDVEMVLETLAKSFSVEVTPIRSPVTSPKKTACNSEFTSPKLIDSLDSVECKSESDYDASATDRRKPGRGGRGVSSSSKSNSPLQSLGSTRSPGKDSKGVPYMSPFKEELDKPISMRQADISPKKSFHRNGDSLNQIMERSNSQRNGFKDYNSDYNSFMAELSSVMDGANPTESSIRSPMNRSGLVSVASGMMSGIHSGLHSGVHSGMHSGAVSGTVSPFVNSAHSVGVSTALSSLPTRPSSAATKTYQHGAVPTELLLLRVASVLKKGQARYDKGNYVPA